MTVILKDLAEILIGCSGWIYGDTPDKDGWTEVFYPDKETRRLRCYSQFFNTSQMEASFYKKFYSQMTDIFDEVAVHGHSGSTDGQVRFRQGRNIPHN